MRIQILGTAAAEGWPAIFCGCETCRRARESGGKDFRSRASIQIDDILKIDLPPDTYYHSVRYGLDLAALKHLFFTHSHHDHFAIGELDYIKPPFAHNLRNAPIRIYGNESVIHAIETRFAGTDMPYELHKLEPFVPVMADHLTFVPIPAQHKPDETALNYVVQSDNSTMLYAADTGLYNEDTFGHLSRYVFDLLIVECTQGKLDMPSHLHMGFDGVLQLRDRLAASGAIRNHTRIVLTHFSHNIGMLHAELEEIANPERIEVAYDGWSTEL